MDQQQYIRFWPFLQEVPDPRDRKGCRHAWSFLLALICIALVSGQKQVCAIAHWCYLHGDELRAILPDSSSRIPSPSTFYRVLRQVDMDALEARVSAYGQAMDATEASYGAVKGAEDSHTYRGQSLDGKVIRGAEAHGQAMHLLGLVRHESGTILGQMHIAEKRNEISMSSVLMEQRDLTGTVTTMDAMLTQRKLAKQLLTQHGHYLMEVKDNHAELKEAIETWFDSEPWPVALEDRETYCYENQGHGREERRTTTTSSALCTYLDWPGGQQVIRRICERLHQGQLLSREVHYGITSLSREQAGPDAIETLWRRHWTIENQVHYVRDETFGEDRGQVHVGHTAQALSALRNAIMTALRHHGWSNLAAALRYHQARLQETLQLVGIPAS